MKEYTKKVKTPILIAMVLQAFSLLVAGLVILAQQNIVGAIYGLVLAEDRGDIKVFPYAAMITIVINLLMYFIFYLVVITKGGNKSTISIVFIVVVVLIRFATFFIPMIITRFMAADGAEMYAIYSSVESLTSMFTAPFTLIAFIMFCISLGRYGVMDMFRLKEALEEETDNNAADMGKLKKVNDTDDQYL